MPIFYLGLAIIGTLIPYAAFVPWLLQNGVDIPQFFSDNPISIFAWLDVVVAPIAPS